MKKLLFLLLASFIVLAACGQEESKSEDKKETKSTDKDSKKEDKKSEDKKDKSDDKEEKSDDKSNEEVATQDETTEQPVQSQEQAPVVEEEPIQQEQQPVQQEPTDQEKMEANAKVAKEHGFTGIPNGDAGLLEPADEYYSNDQLDPDTGLPMDDAVPHKTNE